MPRLIPGHIHKGGRQEPQSPLSVDIPVVVALPELLTQPTDRGVLEHRLPAPVQPGFDVRGDKQNPGLLGALGGLNDRTHRSAPTSPFSKASILATAAWRSSSS